MEKPFVRRRELPVMTPADFERIVTKKLGGPSYRVPPTCQDKLSGIRREAERIVESVRSVEMKDLSNPRECKLEFADEKVFGLSDNVELHLEYEEDEISVQESLVPEVVTRYPGFFDTMASAGLTVLGRSPVEVFEPHQRRFNLLDGVQFMMYEGKIVTGFSVPSLGCEFLREDTYKNLSFVKDGKVVGNTLDVCYGVREKIDGVEVVCFSVMVGSEKLYFLWDARSIRRVKANVEFHAERVGDRYYVLSGSDIPRCFEMDGSELDLVSHEWKEFSRAVIEDAVEGLVFNINFREYKVNRIMSFTFKMDGLYAVDSTGKFKVNVNMEMAKGSCWDLAFDSDVSTTINRDRFVVIGAYDGQMIYRVTPRLDRVYPDSHQQMTVARAKSVKYDDLMKFHVVDNYGSVIPELKLTFREVLAKEVPQEADIFPMKLGKRIVRDNDVTYIGTSRMLKGVYPKHALVDDKRIGNAFKDAIQERNYYQNVKNNIIVINMIKRPTKVKDYVSWGDCFLSFRGNMLTYVSNKYTDSVLISKEFDQYEFQRFCLRHELYLKDGICFSTMLLWQEFFLGYDTNSCVLMLSRRKPRNSVTLAYRRFYVSFRKKE